jgi:uncharacterized protein
LYEGFDARNNNQISINHAKKLLNYLFDLKLKNKQNKLFIGFYGGEPLLNIKFIKQIIEFVDQLKTKKELNIEYHMTTNATLLHEHIDFLVANKFLLMISLDGNEANHSYRVYNKNNQNSFWKVIENADMIQRDYPVYFADHVRFNAVLHNRNSVKEIYNFIYGKYNKIPKISGLALKDVKTQKKRFIEGMYRDIIISEIEYRNEESTIIPEIHKYSMQYQELSDFLKHLTINCYISDLTSLFDIEEKYFPASTCLPFSKKIFLTNRNKLLPCERINYKYALGKVSEDVIIDIPEITRQFNYYYEHLKNVCQYCYKYRFCGLCLFHLRNLDKIGTDKFVCDSFCDQKKFSEKLNRIFSFLENFRKDFSQILENEIAV